LILTLQEVGHKIQEDRHKLVRKLISEHVDKLDACGFEEAQVVNLAFLKLR
jgi:hypothetical protein